MAVYFPAPHALHFVAAGPAAVPAAVAAESIIGLYDVAPITVRAPNNGSTLEVRARYLGLEV